MDDSFDALLSDLADTSGPGSGHERESLARLAEAAATDPSLRRGFRTLLDSWKGPVFRREQETNHAQFEEEYRLPAGTQLIRPSASFVLTLSCNDPQGGPVVINVVSHANVPSLRTVSYPGEGTSVVLPCFVGPPRLERSSDLFGGRDAITIEACFNPESLERAAAKPQLAQALEEVAVDKAAEVFGKFLRASQKASASFASPFAPGRTRLASPACVSATGRPPAMLVPLTGASDSVAATGNTTTAGETAKKGLATQSVPAYVATEPVRTQPAAAAGGRSTMKSDSISSVPARSSVSAASPVPPATSPAAGAFVPSVASLCERTPDGSLFVPPASVTVTHKGLPPNMASQATAGGGSATLQSGRPASLVLRMHVPGVASAAHLDLDVRRGSIALASKRDAVLPVPGSTSAKPAWRQPGAGRALAEARSSGRAGPSLAWCAAVTSEQGAQRVTGLAVVPEDDAKPGKIQGNGQEHESLVSLRPPGSAAQPLPKLRYRFTAPLPYAVDPANGTATFDADTCVLTVTVPVVGPRVGSDSARGGEAQVTATTAWTHQSALSNGKERSADHGVKSTDYDSQSRALLAGTGTTHTPAPAVVSAADAAADSGNALLQLGPLCPGGLVPHSSAWASAAPPHPPVRWHRDCGGPLLFLLEIPSVRVGSVEITPLQPLPQAGAAGTRHLSMYDLTFVAERGVDGGAKMPVPCSLQFAVPEPLALPPEAVYVCDGNAALILNLAISEAHADTGSGCGLTHVKAWNTGAVSVAVSV